MNLKFLSILLFNYFVSLDFQDVPKPSIGVVGDIWYKLMQNKLKQRNELNKVNLQLLKFNYSIPFYQEIQNNYNAIRNQGIEIIFGSLVLSMANAAAHFSIPYLSTEFLPELSDRQEYSNMPHFYALQSPEFAYSFALLDVLNYFKVKRISVVIDSSVDYKNLMGPLFDQKEIEVKLWSLEDENINDFSKINSVIDKILEETRDMKCKDFVIKTRPNIMKVIILRAKYYGLLVRPNRWYLMSFICHDINIAAIRQIFSNITFINELCSESFLRHLPNITRLTVIDKAIQMFRRMKWNISPSGLYKAFKQGRYKIFNKNGVLVKFQFTLHTLNVDEEKPEILQYVGSWMDFEGKSSLRYSYNPTEYIIRKTKKFHLRIAAVEEHPHLIVKQNGSYVGFGVDLLAELSKMMNFTYSINVVANMGSIEEFGWTGVVGEILANRADMSLGPLVETKEKQDVLAFSTSFKQREISLVFRRPKPSTTLFQFIGPFSWTVWMCCISSLIVVTLSMWTVEKIHDKYFTNPGPVRFNMKECSWFSVGCVVKKQIDVFPTSVTGRIIHWTIYFFSVIIITSYTAKLAAFLTLKNYPLLVNSVSELANLPEESKISFGTVHDSDIFEFFRDSSFQDYQKIYKIMKDNPSWIVNSSAYGYKRALKYPYVFIWDDSVNQYEIFTESEYECNLMIVGRPFGKRSFSLGISKNYSRTFREKLDRNLLRLMESGRLESLEDKWWKSTSICASKNSPRSQAEPLSLREVVGVFLILGCGLVISITWYFIKVLACKRKPSKLHDSIELKERNDDIKLMSLNNDNR